MPPRRYAPEMTLPPYTYVPRGPFPHPVRDPGGHRYARFESPPPAPAPEEWRNSPRYLEGIDLFNHGYFWEAHEAWESLWLACGRRGPIADMLKGLIHLAAAGVKLREGVPAGVQSHAHRAAELFTLVAQKQGWERCLGLTLAELRAIAGRANELVLEPRSLFLEPA